MAKLVAIGDSLTQGFHSAAITNTDQSYPAMIAHAMGLDVGSFRQADFRGRGGLPCSIEWLARRLEEQYGANLSTFDWLRAVHTIADYLDEVEDYWERGQGARPSTDVLYHNLAVWGFEVADAFAIDAKLCRRRIKGSKDNWFKPPSEARLRTALRVLNPGHVTGRWQDTQLSVARRIADQEGIEHLIVWLGANNCLGTVVKLQIVESGDDPPGPCSACTLWTPKAFARDYARLAKKVAKIGAQHVYVATVPHVTIPPITRGIMSNGGELPPGEKYFDYYTRCSIPEADFDPDLDPKLTKEQARRIDEYINQYNATIENEARNRGWHVVDACRMLDELAVRRNQGLPRYRLPPALADLSISFFEITPGGKVKRGGLMSLDGVHPTACGYALIAQEFINVMNRHGANARDIDFADVRRWDSLVSAPPRTLDDMVRALGTLERNFHISSWL